MASAGHFDSRLSAPTVSAPAHQAFQILRVGFTVAPVLAGADKFFHFLVNWDQYLAPAITNLLAGHGHEFMLAAGAVEIIAGLGVALKPKIFGWVVGGWLLAIVANLLMTGTYFDIALRDFGLALGAFALARLSQDFD
jgi:hypothetical protein